MLYGCRHLYAKEQSRTCHHTPGRSIRAYRPEYGNADDSGNIIDNRAEGGNSNLL